MCTVTYLPNPSGFVLTHNRDEAPSRSSQSIVSEKTPGGERIIFPRDTQAGGTWIATSRRGRTACLLNGAFVLHKRELPYRRSRGLILLDFFDWENPDSFFQRYDFDRIEPFTFLFFEKNKGLQSTQRIAEFRWDGQQRHLKNLPADQAHFWCSATLYPPEMQTRREQVFKDWLAKHSSLAYQDLVGRKAIAGKQSTVKQITQLHLRGSVGDPEYDFVMNRAGKVQTVSLTQVIVDGKKARMRYLDLLGGNLSERRLSYTERRASSVNR